MSGGRAYHRAEDRRIIQECALPRPARIRALADELGRSETGIRRRWQRLRRGLAPAPPTTAPLVDRIGDALEARCALLLDADDVRALFLALGGGALVGGAWDVVPSQGRHTAGGGRVTPTS